MTTAARPTFEPARGGQGKGETDLSALSKQYSSRDLPSHTKLKFREPAQMPVDASREHLKRDLEERERKLSKEKRSGEKRKGEDREKESKLPRLEALPSSNLDADDPLDEEGDDDDDAPDDDEEDDDTAELMAELQRIKKERAAEEAKRETERRAEEDRIRTEAILSGNPLMPSLGSGGDKADFRVRRRWDDDVVFKNCAKGTMNKKTGLVFINDAIRSEFHKKFMEKYVK